MTTIPILTNKFKPPLELQIEAIYPIAAALNPANTISNVMLSAPFRVKTFAAESNAN